MDKDCTMPKHQYVPDPRIPNWANRILAHPFENTIAVLSIVFGAALIVAAFVLEVVPSKSMENLEPMSALLLAIINAGGGVVTLIGVHWRSDNVGLGWVIERSGLLVTGAGLGAYGMAVLYSYPGSWFSWGQPIVLAIACGLRVVALTITKRWTRLSKEALWNE